MNNHGYIGMVFNGQFRPLVTEKETTTLLRLTTINAQAAQSPDSAEVSLAPYEGTAIMVRGIDKGEWIYSATVVEQAGPILTAVVNRVFGAGGQSGIGELKKLFL